MNRYFAFSAVLVLVVVPAALAGRLTAVAGPQTLVTAKQTIDAFAQDAGEIAWATAPGPCGSVRIRALPAGKEQELISRSGGTCTDVANFSLLSELAVAQGRAVWAVFSGSNQASGGT